MCLLETIMIGKWRSLILFCIIFIIFIIVIIFYYILTLNYLLFLTVLIDMDFFPRARSSF